LTERIWAVQQIYALRNRRFELQPTFAASVNDPFVSHNGFGLAAAYWVTNVLSVGARFMWFGGLNNRSDVDFRVARSARLVVPINEYQLLASLNFTYVPVYGKFMMFNRFIFHWDLFLDGGIGLMRTRPIAVVDPEIRVFSNFNNNIMFTLGIGLRVFINRWFAIIGEIRNYVYLEQLEATMESQPRTDQSMWLDRSGRLTDNVMLQIGVSFFLPATFSYRLQR